MEHVKKGCLTRSMQDLRTDGSRQEGLHKGVNGIQRAHPSGLEMHCALMHEFFLRRNLRAGSEHEFELSIEGAHHIHFNDAIAKLWNELLDDPPRFKFSATEEQSVSTSPLARRPTLPSVSPNEIFGLIHKDNAALFEDLIALKSEDEDDTILTSMSSKPESVAQDLQIDLALLSTPLAKPPVNAGTSLAPTSTAALSSTITPPTEDLSPSVLTENLPTSTDVVVSVILSKHQCRELH